ncbi:MAG: hypothetical protein HY046_13860 [Acidobacteria bacterium]|nr:hypothetical protein [Acidobacteriota bacterium]
MPIFSTSKVGATETKPDSRAAFVLFERFETGFYSEAELLSTSPGTYGAVSERDANDLRFPFWYLLSGLNTLGKSASSEILKSSDSVLVGARDFRGPRRGIGLVRSQICFAVHLRGANLLDIQKYFKSVHAKTAAGRSVFMWMAGIREYGDEDPAKLSTFFAVQASDLFLLVSNNLEEIEAVADRLASSDKTPQMLELVPEWESLSQHRIWGYRRYRHLDLSDRDRHAAGLTHVTPATDALVFFVDLETKICTLRFLTPPDGGKTALNINSLNVVPRFKPINTGVWQSRFSLGDEYTDERIVFVLSLFGFGQYI